MQSVSPEYATAVDRAERAPVVEVTADWRRDGDLTPVRVTGVRITRTLTTGLPDQVDLIAGSAVARATLDLDGDPTDNTHTPIALYSPYRTDADLADVDPEAIPVNVDMGLRVEGTPELLSQMTGTASDMSMSVSAAGSSASLEVLDGTEALKVEPRLPLTVGYDVSQLAAGLAPGSGLNVQWVVDALARQGGYYASPPPRLGCVLSTTLHGSLQADVGELTGVGAFMVILPDLSTAFAEPVYAPGRFALAPAPPAHTVFQSTYALAAPVEPVGGHVTFTGWANLAAAPGPAPAPSADQQWAVADQPGQWEIAFRVVCTAPGSNSLQILVIRGGVTTTITGPTTALTGWTYLGTHVRTTTTQAVIDWRVDATTTTTTTTITTATSGTPMTIGGVAAAPGAEAVQIDTTPWGAGGVQWDNAFSPNSFLEPGQNELIALPPMPAGADCLTLIQQIASAEAGFAFVDELRRFHFWNRLHFEVDTASTTVQAELTAPKVTGLSLSQLAYRIRNVITVRASPLTISGLVILWQEGEVVSVPASGTLVRIVDLGGDQAYAVDKKGWVIPEGGPFGPFGGGHSGYRAAKNQDGTGGSVDNLTMTIEPFASAIKITYTNPNPFPAWFVTPVGGVSPNGGGTYPTVSNGKPTPLITGRRISASTTALDGTDTVDSTGVTVEWREPESVSIYGERTLPIEANPWRQRTDDALALARHIGLRTSFPTPQFGSARVRGRPELQLGDLVELTDGSGRTGLDHEPCIVMGCSSDFTGGDAPAIYTDLLLLPVARPGQLILDVASRDELDSTAVL